MAETTVRNNEAGQRYELEAGGAIAFAAYQMRGNVVVFTHTEVPKALEGQGIAGKLIKSALADVRERGLQSCRSARSSPPISIAIRKSRICSSPLRERQRRPALR